jgi:hypothetical protein
MSDFFANVCGTVGATCNLPETHSILTLTFFAFFLRQSSRHA